MYPQNLDLSIQKTAQVTLKTYPRLKINKELNTHMSMKYDNAK